MLVAGLFALGGLMLWGLFRAPRATSPSAPAAARWGAPAHPIRIASLNVRRLPQEIDHVTDELRKLDPDFVLLQEVDSRDVVALARAFGMQQFHHPNAYERSGNLGGRKATWGNVIFAKHPLYDAGPIPNPGGESFGVWATSIVDGKKFVIANVHLSATPSTPRHDEKFGDNRSKEIAKLVSAWHARGSPPMIVGGGPMQITLGGNNSAMTDRFADVLASLRSSDGTFQTSSPDPHTNRVFATPEWVATDGGMIASEASNHPLTWAALVDANRAAATHSATPATP